MNARQVYDVAIVGGGVIGAMLAYLLARQNVSCCVIDRGVPGQGTAEASAGIVGPHLDPEQPESLRSLLLQSLRAYPWLIAALRDETPITPGYYLWGELRLAFTGAQADQLRSNGIWLESFGFDVSWLDAAVVREDIPVVSSEAIGGLYLADAAGVVVSRLIQALLDAASRRGTVVLQQTPVLGFRTSDDRIVGLQTGAGDILAGQVVLAAGVETSALTGLLGMPMVIEPVRGQMLWLQSVPGAVRMILAGPAGGYVVPRADGLIWVGPTKERGRWDTQPTIAGLQTCLRVLEQLAPSLGAATFVGSHVGLRPGMPSDRLPLIGRIPGWLNGWMASGHEHLGVMLAPGTAELLVSALIEPEEPAALAPFAPGRLCRSQ